MYKGIILTFLIALSWGPFSQSLFAQSTQESNCSDALTELIDSDKVSRVKVQKFLKLQADLTMHKMAYSLHRHLLTTERFKLEDQILALANQLDSGDQEFQTIKEQFESNKLSRKHLASIMPYIKDIVNDQMYESDPFKRKNFLIGKNDLKILAVLGEAEIRFNTGRYDSRFISNHNSMRSVLNLTRVINNAIESSKLDSGDIQKKIGKRLQDIQVEIVNLIDSIRMPEECIEIYSSCRETSGDQGIIDEGFLNIMMDVADRASGFYRYRYLKHGDANLVTKPNEVGAKILKEQDDKVVSSKDLKKTESDVVQDYLIQHVLNHLPYFTTKEILKKDSELLYSLAKAIDAGTLTQKNKEKRVFHYKGDTYYLPELWNGTYSGNRLVKEYKEWFSKERIVPVKKFFNWGDDFDFPSNISSKEEKDFERVRNEQLHIFKNNLSFDYRGKLYDIQTGELIEPSLQGLLKYKKGLIRNSTGDENNASPEYNARKAQAIESGERSYITDDEVFHISGQPVDLGREYERYKSHYKSTHLKVNKTANSKSFPSKQKVLDLEQIEPVKYALVIKAMTDKKRAFTHEGKTYDLYSKNPFTPLTKKESKSLLNDQRVGHHLTMRQNVSPENTTAILNDDDFYIKEGRLHNTLSGREIASKLQVVEVEDGYYEHDQIFHNELKLNDSDNEEILKAYFQSPNANSCQYHTVIDKKKSLLKVYNRFGKVLLENEIILGRGGDSKKIGSTPAGILYSDLDENSKLSYLPELEIGAIKSSEINELIALNNTVLSDNRISNGRVMMSESSFKKYKDSYYNNDCPTYVIPDRDDIKFQLRDGKLEFKPTKHGQFSKNCIDEKKECYGDYYFNEYESYKAKDIRISFEDLSHENEVSKAFATSLVKNKKDLMGKLDLSNGEYNELSKMAIAVLGVESGFGTEISYKTKEVKGLAVVSPGLRSSSPTVVATDVGQNLVTALKMHDKLSHFDWFGDEKLKDVFDPDSYKNSRGLTQIKDVREFLKDEYPKITEESLNDPKNAAIATMFVLSKKYHLLEYLKSHHPAINEVNKYDYLYYIYSGSSHRIKTRNATPVMNQRSRELVGYASKIKVLTK